MNPDDGLPFVRKRSTSRFCWPAGAGDPFIESRARDGVRD